MTPSARSVSRRTLFAGAGTAGALAAAASLLPSVRESTQADATPKAPPAKGGGYQLTEHVQRYFKTTRI